MPNIKIYISGKYETFYGNICIYKKGSKTAFDIDMQERIPLEMVNFQRKLIKGNIIDVSA